MKGNHVETVKQIGAKSPGRRFRFEITVGSRDNVAVEPLVGVSADRCVLEIGRASCRERV